MKKVFFLPYLILITALAYGQDSVLTVSKNKYFHVDFGVGFAKIDLSSINTSITSLGYRPLSEDFASLSISSAFVIDRVMIRNEVSFLMPNTTQQSENLTSSFGVRNIGFGIGYVIIERPAFRLYPFVNLNAFVGRLAFEDNAPVGDMDGLLNTPHYSSRLHFSNASLDFGLQLERVVSLKQRKWDCPQNKGFMTIGLRAGYSFCPGKIEGRYNGMNQPIAGVPTFSNKGPYLKLVLGFGSKMRDLKWKK
jgi:hypothetical protein